MSTIFPKWWNLLPPVLLVGGLGSVTAVVGAVWYYATPKFWEVGYMPTQPGGGYNHAIHVGKLGMDCRYCHTNVETSWHANIPNVSTCMNCHTEGRLNADIEANIGEKVAFIREAYANNQSIEWRQVHKLPDYVRFPHHVHVNAGVSCYSCHGEIGRMDVVVQREPISMAWCLDCHRKDAVNNLVDPSLVTDLFAVEKLLADHEAQKARGAALLGDLESKGLHLLPENCGACHY